MSTHNICFCGEIRKLLCGYPLLSVAMHSGPGLHCSQWMIIAPDKVLFFFHPKSMDIFLILPQRHVMSTHQKHLREALLTSTHNICFCEEIRKILSGWPLFIGLHIFSAYRIMGFFLDMPKF